MQAHEATIRVLGFSQKISTDKDGKTVTHDWVTFAPVHAPLTTVNEERVSRLKPPEHIKNDDAGMKMNFMRMRWREIEPAYEAWKNGMEIPVSGIPISAWPGVTQDQAQALRMGGYRTVDEIARATDSQIAKAPLPNMRELRDQANRFLEQQDANAAAEKTKERDAKIDALQSQLDDALAMLDKLTGPKVAAKPAKEAA